MLTDMENYQDIHTIERNLVRYCTGIDRRDWGPFKALFTPRCTLDYGDIGQWSSAEEITDYMDRTHAPMGYTMHRLTNLVVDLDENDADRAVSRSYVDVLLTSADAAGGSNACGYYDDRWVRTDIGWQIAARTFTLVKLTLFKNVPLNPADR